MIYFKIYHDYNLNLLIVIACKNSYALAGEKLFTEGNSHYNKD